MSGDEKKAAGVCVVIGAGSDGIGGAVGLEPEPEPEPVATTSSVQRRQHGHAIAPADFPCRFYPKGRCQKGDGCPFRHDPALLQQPKETQPDPTLTTHGPAELTEILGAALLCQWRGDGKHKACTHGFHSRKAVMNPLAVSQLLQLLPGERAVLDPFVGSGTTMIEVMIAGRPAVGCDVSPLAVGISKYHCWRPRATQLDEFRVRVAAVVNALPDDDDGEGSDRDTEDAAGATVVPDAGQRQGTTDWRHAERVVSEQAGKSSLEVAGALHFLFSHEELYEWPAWRRQRSLAWRFQRTAERYMEKLAELAAAVPSGTAQAEIWVTDARSGSEGEDHSYITSLADGVLTSPPYPGVYSYVADESDVGRGLSSWALSRQSSPGVSVQAEVSYERLATLEIGSQQQREELEPDAFEQRWQADTEAWLQASAEQLRPGGRIVMLIGDNAGVDALESIRAAAGSIHVAPHTGCSRLYDLRVIASASVAEDARRPWSSKKRNYRSEHTILLEKVTRD